MVVNIYDNDKYINNGDTSSVEEPEKENDISTDENEKVEKKSSSYDADDLGHRLCCLETAVNRIPCLEHKLKTLETTIGELTSKLYLLESRYGYLDQYVDELEEHRAEDFEDMKAELRTEFGYEAVDAEAIRDDLNSFMNHVSYELEHLEERISSVEDLTDCLDDIDICHKGSKCHECSKSESDDEKYGPRKIDEVPVIDILLKYHDAIIAAAKEFDRIIGDDGTNVLKEKSGFKKDDIYKKIEHDRNEWAKWRKRFLSKIEPGSSSIEMSEKEWNDIRNRAMKNEEKEDVINHPSHYTDGKYEVIDFIEDYRLPFHLGNAVKYICRAGKKDPDKYVEDLKKALWYLRRWNKLHKLAGMPRNAKIDVSDFCNDKGLRYIPELKDVIVDICYGSIYEAECVLRRYLMELELIKEKD